MNKNGYINPIPYDVFSNITVDMSVPGPAVCLADYMQMGIRSMFFYNETGFYEREKEEQVVLPFHDPSHPQQF